MKLRALNDRVKVERLEIEGKIAPVDLGGVYIGQVLDKGPKARDINRGDIILYPKSSVIGGMDSGVNFDMVRADEVMGHVVNYRGFYDKTSTVSRAQGTG